MTSKETLIELIKTSIQNKTAKKGDNIVCCYFITTGVDSHFKILEYVYQYELQHGKKLKLTTLIVDNLFNEASIKMLVKNKIVTEKTEKTEKTSLIYHETIPVVGEVISENIDEICCICFENKVQLQTNCRHNFCKPCISNWLHKNPTDEFTCPCCRTIIQSYLQINTTNLNHTKCLLDLDAYKNTFMTACKYSRNLKLIIELLNFAKKLGIENEIIQRDVLIDILPHTYVTLPILKFLYKTTPTLFKDISDDKSVYNDFMHKMIGYGGNINKIKWCFNLNYNNIKPEMINDAFKGMCLRNNLPIAKLLYSINKVACFEHYPDENIGNNVVEFKYIHLYENVKSYYGNTKLAKWLLSVIPETDLA